MAAIESGRVCIVTSGRRAGKQVVITKVLQQAFVRAKFTNVAPEKAKERKYSSAHLEPVNQKIEA